MTTRIQFSTTRPATVTPLHSRCLGCLAPRWRARVPAPRLRRPAPAGLPDAIAKPSPPAASAAPGRRRNACRYARRENAPGRPGSGSRCRRCAIPRKESCVARREPCQRRPSEGAVAASTGMPKRRAPARAPLEWIGSTLALYEKQQLLQRDGGLLQRRRVARCHGRIDFLVQVDRLLTVFGVHFGEQPVRTLQQALYFRVAVRARGGRYLDHPGARIHYVFFEVFRRLPTVIPHLAARLVQLLNPLTPRRDLLGALRAQRIGDPDVLRFTGPLLHRRDLQNAVQIEAHAAKNLVGILDCGQAFDAKIPYQDVLQRVLIVALIYLDIHLGLIGVAGHVPLGARQRQRRIAPDNGLVTVRIGISAAVAEI